MAWLETLLNDPVGQSLLNTQLQSVNFVVSQTEFWRADISPRLNWQVVQFRCDEISRLPEEPGLYAFVARIPFEGLPLHGWVMYIGQTGDGNSGATLRRRFRQYLRDKGVSERPAIYYMLNAWDDCLEFFYAPEPSRKDELKELETRLLGAFRPPFSDRTYPAAFMSPRHAF